MGEKELTFSNNMNEIIALSRACALKLNNEFIGTQHLLLSILLIEECIAYKILKKLGLNIEKITKLILNNFYENKEIDVLKNTFLTFNAEEVLKNSFPEAKLYDNEYIDSGHLLLSLLHNPIYVSSQILNKENIDYVNVRIEFNKIVYEPKEFYLPPNNRIFSKYFYKFIPDDEIIISNIIENELIRFSQRESLNDKFDMQLQIDELFGLERFIDQIDYNSDTFYDNAISYIPQELVSLYGNKEELINLTKLVQPLVKDILEKNIGIFEREFTKTILPAFDIGINQALGVLCLSEDVSNNPMWAHYANNHKGFAIQFNAQHEYFYKPLMGKPIRPVFYSDQTPIINNLLDASKSNMDVMMDWVFLNKSKEWEYEREWRIIKPIVGAFIANCKDRANNPIFLLPFPREIVTGIIFGYDIDLEKKKRILDKIRSDKRYNHIIPYESDINRCSRKIEIRPIS